MSKIHKHLSEYIKEIDKIYRQGNATEHSYRHALKALLDNVTTGLSITNEPKHISCGAPDYVITKDNIPLGFIEAKDITKGINNKSDQKQFVRYIEALGNLLITDYINFNYYKDSNLVCIIKIGEEKSGKIIENKNDFDKFNEVINQFVSYNGKTITKSEPLAKLMASKTKFLSEILKGAVSNNENGNLHEQLKVFKEYLIHDLTEEQFSDIYAQTIAYGLFAAKLYKNDDYIFTRLSAANLIPKSNPFLKRFFHYIIGPDLDKRIVWIVDAIADMFNIVDITAIKKEFDDTDKDPYIHFYETFLNEYDKTTKKERGVYYTPTSIVKFIVRSVDDILKNEFKIEKGIADSSMVNYKIKQNDGSFIEEKYHKVQILDPATGTGTFLSEVIDKIHKYFLNNQGVWNGYCENHLIPRIHGFEYLMASYTMAHLKTDMKLKETGYSNTEYDNNRLGIYLTNTLEEPKEDIPELFFAKWLSDEALAAQKVKRDTPVMVVLGNPPYSKESSNITKKDFLSNYKFEPGGKEKLKEKNPKWLNDDYVKFIRFGQSLIEKHNIGILAYITNNGFLDNPTFRGMRWHLLRTFNKIYILDLHGSVLETAPEGTPDENVFNIKTSVSINIFIKNNKKDDDSLADVYYSEIYGKNEYKYDYLTNNSLQSIIWKKVEFNQPQYYFKPFDFSNTSEYMKGFKINELFNSSSLGIVTARDEFSIKQTSQELIKTIKEFLSLDNETARTRFNLGKDAKEWSINDAKKDLNNNKSDNGQFNENDFVKILNNPFDIRYTYYTGNSKGFHCRPRGNIMRHFIVGENVGLLYNRCFTENSSPIFITDHIIRNRCWSRSGSESVDYISPLYLYSFDDITEKQHNMNNEIINLISNKIALRFADNKDTANFTPLDILDYVYAVLNNPSYIRKYKELFKLDFPRIPYPESKEQFIELANLGTKLRKLHLFIDIKTPDNINYPIDGNHKISKVLYKQNKVFINENQYFDNISEQIWDYYIGAYQPARMWLKSRNDMILSYDDIEYYKKIIYILSETINIQNKIDEFMIVK